MPKRYDESCLSVYIYKLSQQFTSHDVSSSIRESLKLSVVTKVGTDTEIIYDEGNTRPIRKDIYLTLEAIITQNKDTEFDDSWEYGNERPWDTARIRPINGDQPLGSSDIRGGNPINNQFVDTAAMITFFNEFLSTPGLAVDLSHYPSEVTNILSSKSVNGATTLTNGYLVDSFNGPQPISIKMVPMAGGNDFQLVWKVKFSVSTQSGANYGIVNDTPRVDISSELRLDIDSDGDLQIIVAGTMYAANPYQLYKARDYLNISIEPKAARFRTTEIIDVAPQIPVDTSDEYTSLFAQVNGFYRETVFNIEKSGRSAKFMITYKQVKSNSALPLGIKTIEFDHEVSSSLFGTNIFEGMGFTSWKSAFSGKMKVPHRFNANYVWFVIFYIIAQKTRKLGKFTAVDKPPVASELTQMFNDEKGTVSPVKAMASIKGLPTFLRLKHRHFSREVDFTVEYLVLAPLQYVISATCLFERINNDYYKRFLMPRTADGALSPNYRPEKLSQQWMDWNRSVLPETALDPTSVTGTSPLTVLEPLQFKDNSGMTILDTGHEINPFVPKAGIGNNDQKFLLVSRVIDPNEEDPDYASSYTRFYPLPNPNGFGSSGGSPSLADIDSVNYDNAIKEQGNQSYPTGINTNTNAYVIPAEEMDPRLTWIKFEESYEIISTHPTIPTESLTNVDYKAHSEPELYRDFINSAEYPSVASALGVNGIPDIAAEQEHVLASGLRRSTSFSSSAPSSIVDTSDVVRKTFAAKASRYYVKVQGFALRVKYPIAIPTVISIAGAPAIKVGLGRSKIIPSGLSGNMPVYLAFWEQVYTVDKDISGADILSSIESTGASIHYA
jgi:hypothetical protein